MYTHKTIISFQQKRIEYNIISAIFIMWYGLTIMFVQQCAHDDSNRLGRFIILRFVIIPTYIHYAIRTKRTTGGREDLKSSRLYDARVRRDRQGPNIYARNIVTIGSSSMWTDVVSDRKITVSDEHRFGFTHTLDSALRLSHCRIT